MSLIKKTKTAAKVTVNELKLFSSLNKKRRNDISDLLMWPVRPPYMGKFGLISSDPKFKKLAILLETENRKCLNTREMWNIYNSVIKLRDIEGVLAEVGVYRGGSAKLMSEVKGGKALYLFDTFKGIPNNDYSINQLDSKVPGDDLETVKAYLTGYDNLYFYPGIFPQSAKSIKKDALKFSFVHLDTDIYEATRDSLIYFYPLMTKGGIILTHDYSAKHLPGVRKAFDEFFQDKPEKIMSAATWGSTQAFVVIV